jgi:hypothetical protein
VAGSERGVIAAAFRSIYRDPPRQQAGIIVFARDDHWHLAARCRSVTGATLVLTFRPLRPAEQPEAPGWAVNVLRNIARHVSTSGDPFTAGHQLDLHGPIALSRPDTRIRAVLFAEEPELGRFDNAEARVRFLQIVGITDEEYVAIQRWKAAPVLTLLADRIPLLGTDLDRPSITSDPAVAATIEAGAARDGSSTASLFVSQLSWRIDEATPEDAYARVVIAVGASAAERIGRGLAGRLPYGRNLTVLGGRTAVRFRPGDPARATASEEQDLEVTLTPPAVAELRAVLRPEAGIYPLRGVRGLTLHIVRSTIRDPAGNAVENIG